MRIPLLLPFTLLLGAVDQPPKPAWSGNYALCEGVSAARGRDGRLLGHWPYPQAWEGDLVRAPASLAPAGDCLVNRAMLPDLEALAARASAAGLGEQLRAVSCYRPISYQAGLFCRGIGPDGSATAAQRAWSSAPPGHSEHSTGYVLDFGRSPQAGCPDLDGCFPATAAGKWLLANASSFGFELSFPAANKQGVGWEPWHWRWVGRPGNPAGIIPRRLFARARAYFPGTPGPGDPPIAVQLISQPSAPQAAPPPEDEQGKKRRKRRQRDRSR